MLIFKKLFLELRLTSSSLPLLLPLLSSSGSLLSVGRRFLRCALLRSALPALSGSGCSCSVLMTFAVAVPEIHSNTCSDEYCNLSKSHAVLQLPKSIWSPPGCSNEIPCKRLLKIALLLQIHDALSCFYAMACRALFALIILISKNLSVCQKTWQTLALGSRKAEWQSRVYFADYLDTWREFEFLSQNGLMPEGNSTEDSNKSQGQRPEYKLPGIEVYRGFKKLVSGHNSHQAYTKESSLQILLLSEEAQIDGKYLIFRRHSSQERYMLCKWVMRPSLMRQSCMNNYSAPACLLTFKVT